MAHKIVVNSNFTRGVFQEHFPLIAENEKLDKKRSFLTQHLPDILYPPINLKTFEKSPSFSSLTINELLGGGSHETIITSLNRYERKKNIPLAIKAFAKSGIKATLVIAGGWDPRVEENV